MQIELLTSLLDALPLGVVLLDEKGRIAHYNRYEEQLAHRRREDVMGRMFFKDVAPCMNVTELGTVFRDSIGQRSFRSAIDFSFRFPHLTLPMDVKVVMESMAIDERQYACLFIEDVSSRRTLERMRETFTSMVVHDLKSPLAVMLSGFDYLKETAPQDNVDVFEAISDGLNAGKRLQRQLLDLMDLSRAETESLPVKRVETDLAALVTATVTDARLLGRDRSVHIAARLPPSGATGRVDGQLLRRALDNLIDNALRYSPPGSTIEVALEAAPDKLLLSVRDEGPGIPEAQQAAIFEKFGQTAGSKLETSLNRGLGLTFVRLAARAHGGDAQVSCPPGGGTVFTVAVSRG